MGTQPDIDHNTSGLYRRETPPVDAVATIDAGEHGPVEFWRTIAETEAFTRTLTAAVRDLLAETPYYRRTHTLFDAGVTAAEGGYARLAAGFDRPPESDAYELARDVTQQFGSGEVTPLGRLPFDELEAGPLAIFDAAETVPTLTVTVGPAFRERRREHRERICHLLARLSDVCNVAVIMTGLTARWLAREHGEQLPRSFSEQCTTGGETSRHVAPETLEHAHDTLDTEGRAVRILRDLAGEPAETLSYSELQAIHDDVSTARVSQLINELEELELLEKYGPRTDQQVDLLPAGGALLELLDSETAGQEEVECLFSETGQCRYSDVLSRPRGRGGEDTPPQQQPQGSAGPYRTRFLDRATHHAAAAAAPEGGITAVDVGSPPAEPGNRRTRYVSYDQAGEEAVVAVRASTPLQYMVSVALGLTSPRLFDKALPTHSLENIDEPPAILRDARCIGGLSTEAVDDPTVFRERLQEWRQELTDMTRKLHRGECDDRDRLSGEILRSAHGLAGTIVHLFDMVDVDLVRELRVPKLSDEQMAELARTVAVATAIQSRYGAFTAYRQLFEDREQKRQTALSPRVDATDATGSYIGGMTIRGPRGTRFGRHVEATVAKPAEIHEDAPEFNIELPVGTTDRAAYTEATNRMLATKNMRATPDGVTLLEAFAADIYAVTEGIRWLGAEEQPRTIRLDEVRYALAKLDPDRLLEGAPPSLSAAFSTLLRSANPLTNQELADAADISTRSLRRHIDGLLTLDVIRETDAGYRVSLPGEGERGEQIIPEPVTEELRPDELTFETVVSVLPSGECGRLVDPNDPLGRPFCGPGFDPGPLHTHLPGSNPYLPVALSLSSYDSGEPPAVRFGPPLEQSSLQASTGVGAV